jgi:Methyltransferase FkbM domain
VRKAGSDGREQELVREFFGGARSGVFVEVGANRPWQGSQSWHLEQLGWTACWSSRSRSSPTSCGGGARRGVYAVACSSPQNAGRRMRLHVAGALSSLDRERMAAGAEPARFELLSIDVEGHELEVLAGFDVARWRPRLILLEDHVGDLARHRRLKTAGYRLIRRFEYNGWYVPDDAPAAVEAHERWEIIRKYYLALPFRMARNASRAARRRLKSRRAD